MGNEEGLKLTGFVTKPGEQAKKAVRFSGGAGGSRRKRSGAAAYLFIRLGVCVLLFCGVLALKLSKGTENSRASALLDKALGQDAQPDTGGLGKLRFVQIPSIIDVFAPSDKPVLPVESRSRSLENDDTLLCIAAVEDDVVYCPCAAVVRAAGYEEEKGGYVKLGSKTESDTEICVYGLKTVCVEQGQPVVQRDILGSAAEGGIRVEVFVKGRPTEPAEYFGLGSMQ